MLHRFAQRRLWKFHDQTAHELVAANKAQLIAKARFEAALDIMEKLVASGEVRPRSEFIQEPKTQ